MKVLRSVFLDPDDDDDLRRLAFDLNTTKSDLIREAIKQLLPEFEKRADEARKGPTPAQAESQRARRQADP